MKFRTVIEGAELDFDFTHAPEKITLADNPEKVAVDLVSLGKNAFSLLLNGKSHYLTITRETEGFEVTVDHHTHIVLVQDETEILLKKFGLSTNHTQKEGQVYAQIPGMVSRIFVKQGDEIKAQQKLLILEAMKMENEIDSPFEGRVKAIHVSPGSAVEKGDIIMEIDS